MSEGGEGGGGAAINVTAGVAMREPPMAPEKPRKRFENLIDSTIKKSADKNIKKILEAQDEIILESFRTGEHVTVGGKKAEITGYRGPQKEKESGKLVNPESFTVTFEDGSERKVSANEMTHLKGNGDNFSGRAKVHFDRAQVNRRWHGSGAYHTELSLGHAQMAKYHNFHGDAAKEKESADLSVHHADLAKKVDARDRVNVAPRDHASGLKYNPSFRQSYPSTKPKPDLSFRHYYKVPFSDKDKAKKEGLRWDPTAKKWYRDSWTDKPIKIDWPVTNTVDLKKK